MTTSSHHRTALLIAAFAASSMVVLTERVLQRFPDSADEHAYLYQAKTFLAGRLTNPPAPIPQAFTPPHIISNFEATYSKYPPGWPAVLTLGVSAGAPHLVNPVLAVVLLVFVYLCARRMFDLETALLLLLLLASNAYYMLNGATLLSHASAALAFFSCLWGVWCYAHAERTRHACLAGAALGALALIRPQDAFGLSVGLLPILVLVARGRNRRTTLMNAASASVPLALALAFYGFYNWKTNGSPFRFGHTVYMPEDHFSWNFLGALKQIPDRLLEYLWINPAALLAPLGFWKFCGETEKRSSGRALLWLVAAFWGVFAFYLMRDFPPRFGPRYLYPTHPIIFAFVAVALLRIVPKEWRAVAIGGVVVLQLAHMTAIASDVRPSIAAEHGPLRVRRKLAEEISPHGAYLWLVGVTGGAPPLDLLHNNPEFDDRVLLFTVPFLSNGVRQRLDPDRFLYVWDGMGGAPTVFAESEAAPVQWVALGEDGPLVLDNRETRAGWLATTGEAGCVREPPTYPGRRPGAWSARGPCGRGDRAYIVPAPDLAKLRPEMKLGPRYYAQFRSFALVEETGKWSFEIASDAPCVFGSGGRYFRVPPTRQGERTRTMQVTFPRSGRIPVLLVCEEIRDGASLSFSVSDSQGDPLPPDRFVLSVAYPATENASGERGP